MLLVACGALGACLDWDELERGACARPGTCTAAADAGAPADAGVDAGGGDAGGPDAGAADAGPEDAGVDGGVPDFEWARWVLPASAPDGSSYVTNTADGTVLDATTGLVWQRASSSPQSWDGGRVYCLGLMLGGVPGWRLPTLIELESIVDYGRANPSIDPAFPATPSSTFWTSTARANSDAGEGWAVDFAAGETMRIVPDDLLAVRCVR